MKIILYAQKCVIVMRHVSLLQVELDPSCGSDGDDTFQNF
jgi:hypothetical protein